jgi:hypothetical protein
MSEDAKYRPMGNRLTQSAEQLALRVDGGPDLHGSPSGFHRPADMAMANNSVQLPVL